MGLTPAQFLSGLKKVQLEKRVDYLAEKDNPFFLKLKKEDTLHGEGMKVPMKLSGPAGIGADFAAAKASKKGGVYTHWELTRAKGYGIFSIDYETLIASSTDNGAFFKAKVSELEMIMSELAADVERSLFGDGSGVVGRVSSSTTLASTVLKLVNPNDVINFAIGRVLRLSTAAGGGSLKSGSVTITKINPDNGEITLDQNLSTGITLAAHNDYIFFDGDMDAKIVGLAGWLPASAPTGGDNHFGVDRSVDPVRLAGHRVDGVGKAIEQVLAEAAARIARYKGKPDICWMSFDKYLELQLALGSKVQYCSMQKAEILFKGIAINGPKGPIECYPAPNCPDNRIYMLDSSTWSLRHMKKVPHIQDMGNDGNIVEENADSIEKRVVYFAQLCCINPGVNAVILL